MHLLTKVSLLWLWVVPIAHAMEGGPYCGKEGVWLQTLGSGGAELDDRFAPASYLVWFDDRARLLVDAGPGSSVRFDEAGAKLEDLDAIALTHLHADHASDLPAFIAGSVYAARRRPLPVLGPDGNETFPSTEQLVERLIGPKGAFPYLSDFLTFRSSGGYKVAPRNVPSTGQRRWAQFGTDNLRLSAIPVDHGGTPAIAWRVQIGDHAITFSGDFSNKKNLMAGFAKGSAALVIHHSITEGARGELRDQFVSPSQIGRIAKEADVRMLILGHRMNRTRGLESQTTELIRQSFEGPLIYANDLECWGL